MKIKYTLAAMAATTLAVSAATNFTNAGVTTTDGGNYDGVAANLGDAGWAITGDSVDTTVALTGFTIYRRAGSGSDDVDAYLNVYDSGGVFVGSSTNAFNFGTTITAEGAAAAYSFANLVITTAETYQYRLSTTTADGDLNVTARLQVVQPEVLDNGYMLNTSYNPQDTAWDTKYSIDVTAVPEPSSAALLGLGGLALILRRRK